MFTIMNIANKKKFKSINPKQEMILDFLQGKINYLSSLIKEDEKDLWTLDKRTSIYRKRLNNHAMSEGTLEELTDLKNHIRNLSDRAFTHEIVGDIIERHHWSFERELKETGDFLATIDKRSLEFKENKYLRYQYRGSRIAVNMLDDYIDQVFSTEEQCKTIMIFKHAKKCSYQVKCENFAIIVKTSELLEKAKITLDELKAIYQEKPWKLQLEADRKTHTANYYVTVNL